MKKKILLGFSGGLDTSYCAVLFKEQGYDVHAVTIQTGGFSSEDLEEIRTRARDTGVDHFEVLDVTREYYDRVIRFLIFGNMLKNNTYPLSVSAERVTQAIALARYARKVQADAIAHGSTGAGNDQVRFDLVFQIMLPGIPVITPIRDKQLSREEEQAYLRDHGIEIPAKQSTYSINQGLWGTSVGGKETLTSHLPLPEDAWPSQATETLARKITIGFEKGEPKRLDEQIFDHPVQLIQELNRIAAPYGIGRDIHVGDTIIGIKGRVGFEAAAALLIIKAHHALEKHVLTKWQIYWKDQLSQWYANWLHDGQLLDPVMRDLEAFLVSTQQNVTGEVYIEIHPKRFVINGIHSDHDLMGARFGAYGETQAGWTGEDVRGFTRILSNQTAMYYQLNPLPDEFQ